MGKIFKFLGIVAFVALIGLSMIACGDDGQGDLLNGVWDRGDIVVTFSGNTGVFTEIKSNSTTWIPLLNNGTIKIGDRKFRNISYENNLKWTGQELTYDLSTFVTGWENTTLTVSANGQTLTVSTPTAQGGVTTYTKR